MKIVLLAIGKTTSPHFGAGIDDYLNRIRHYLPMDIEIIPELKNTKSLSADIQKEKEADLLFKALQPGDNVVLLDEHGKTFRSVEFASWIQKKMTAGIKRLVFVIGGSFGLAESLKKEAKVRLSMSPMTFPHHLARVMVLEQIYRAFKINEGSSYHK